MAPAIPSDVVIPDKKLASRGLLVFVGEIRKCKNKQQEYARVQKELHNIRAKLYPSEQQKNTQKSEVHSRAENVAASMTHGHVGTKALNSYNKRKYAWKLVYIYMLGYDVEFGHRHVLDLLSSKKFHEKQAGYLAVSVLLHNESPLMPLLVNSIRKDLLDASSPPHFKSLALGGIANLGGRDLASALGSDLSQICLSPRSETFVRQRACLALARMVRDHPKLVDVPSLDALSVLFLDSSTGVHVAASSLVNAVLNVVPKVDTSRKAVKRFLPACLNVLHRLVIRKQVSADYLYYATPSPWLQCGLFRILAKIPIESFEPLDFGVLKEVLYKVTSTTDVTQNPNKNNADHAVLFEVVDLVVGKRSVPSLAPFFNAAVVLMCRFVEVREPNIRYLGLSTMGALAHDIQLTGYGSFEHDGETVKNEFRRYRKAITFSLKNDDLSIRKVALDLLYQMCDAPTSKDTILELLKYLDDTGDPRIKEEMALKIAILAERFLSDSHDYLDTMLRLIEVSGDYVSSQVWHRVVQVVTNTESVQEYAATSVYRTLLYGVGARVHGTTIKVSAYVLGEFGYLLTESDSSSISPLDIFGVLHRHFATSDKQIQSLLLASYAKLLNLYEELEDAVLEVFKKYSDDVDVEVQQRCVEFRALFDEGPQAMASAWEPMPEYPGLEGLSTEPRSAKCAAAAAAADAAAAKAQPDAAADAVGEPSPIRKQPPAPIQAEIDVRILKKALSTATLVREALLFRDEVVQAGSRTSFSGHKGLVTLYLENLSSDVVSAEYENNAIISIETNSPPGLRVVLKTDPIPAKLKTKCQLIFDVECVGPFQSPPTLEIRFNNTIYPLKLPVTVCNFLSPADMPVEIFDDRWAKLESSDSTSPTLESFNAFFKLPKLLAMCGLHMIRSPSDPSARIPFCACGTLRTSTKSDKGTNVTIGCLVNVRTVDQMAKVSVRAAHPAASKAVCLTIARHLEVV